MMSIHKERFKSLCLEVLPLINGIMEAVKRNGYEEMISLSIGGSDYFSFSVHDTGWRMGKVNGGPVNIRYEFEEEIRLQDQQKEKLAYSKASENLVEISLVYSSLQAGREELGNIDSTTWKQLFVQWANDFETVYAGTDWNQKDYLEEIERFACHKILEYAGLEG